MSVVMGSELVTDYLGCGVTGITAIDAAIPANTAERWVKRVIEGYAIHIKDGEKAKLRGIVTAERDNRRGCSVNSIAGTVNRH